jgi:uncharacterized protein YyaL (SSP411 family)
MLSVLDFYLGGAAEVALVGKYEDHDMRALLRAVREPYVPNKVVAATQPGDVNAPREIPLLEGRKTVQDRAAAYVCRNYVCQAPTTDPAEVRRLLAGEEDEGIEV